MNCRAALCLATVVVLLTPVVALSQGFDAPTSGDASSQSTQDARLMQQADHQRRLMEQPKATLAVDETGAVAATEEPSAAGIDIAVIVVMAVSGLAFLIVCRLRGNSVKKCITPRRTRHNYPSET